MTLRLKIVLICAGVTAMVVAVAGTALVQSVSADLRKGLDRDLEAVSSNFSAPIINGLANDVVNPERTEELLGGMAVRGVFRGETVFRLGRVPDVVSSPRPGFDTVEASSLSLRRFSRTVRTNRGQVSIEVFASLAPIDDRISFLGNRAFVVGAVAVLVAGSLAALLGRAVTNPLRRLRLGAQSIATSGDLDRPIDVGRSSREVEDVAVVLNEMLERLGAESEKTLQSLEAARAFASDATHELRTPLTAIANNVEILLRHRDLPETERVEILEEITERQAVVTQVLGALRDLSRGDLPVAADWEELDMAELADAALAALPVDSTISTELIARGEHILRAWPEGVRILLDNLLSNAATHGRALDGRVRIEVSVTSDSSGVKLAVGDSGLGIAAADVDRLQRRFERGDSHSGGHGLGLAMVRQQVDLHGGELIFGRSRLGGAQVTVVLPRADASAHRAFG